MLTRETDFSAIITNFVTTLLPASGAQLIEGWCLQVAFTAANKSEVSLFENLGIFFPYYELRFPSLIFLPETEFFAMIAQGIRLLLLSNDLLQQQTIWHPVLNATPGSYKTQLSFPLMNVLQSEVSYALSQLEMIGLSAKIMPPPSILSNEEDYVLLKLDERGHFDFAKFILFLTQMRNEIKSKTLILDEKEIPGERFLWSSRNGGLTSGFDKKDLNIITSLLHSANANMREFVMDYSVRIEPIKSHSINTKILAENTIELIHASFPYNHYYIKMTELYQYTLRMHKQLKPFYLEKTYEVIKSALPNECVDLVMQYLAPKYSTKEKSKADFETFIKLITDELENHQKRNVHTLQTIQNIQRELSKILAKPLEHKNYHEAKHVLVRALLNKHHPLSLAMQNSSTLIHKRIMLFYSCHLKSSTLYDRLLPKLKITPHEEKPELEFVPDTNHVTTNEKRKKLS